MKQDDQLLLAGAEGVMAIETARIADQTRELGRVEGWDPLEREAQRYLHMSAREFIAAWKAGQFGDPDQNSDLISLAMLLALVGENAWSEE